MTESRQFSHRMPEKVIERVDAYASSYGISRTAAINILCLSALVPWERGQRFRPSAKEA